MRAQARLTRHELELSLWKIPKDMQLQFYHYHHFYTQSFVISRCKICMRYLWCIRYSIEAIALWPIGEDTERCHLAFDTIHGL